MIKVLIIGSGGREHALGWKLGQSDRVTEVIYAPGNAGTQEEKGRNIPIDGSKKDNFPALFDFVSSEGVDMVVVGPEAPLADGVVNHFNSKGYDRIFGPTREASLLESDKFFSYDLMSDLDIPQADSIKCYSTDEAVRAINERTTKDGIVIKARGLTGGKGVTVCDSREQALVEIRDHAEKYGPEVLIAERMFGPEFSVFGISDGKRVSALEMAVQDHKRLSEGDLGPNTGGMGAYCPVPIAGKDVVLSVGKDIMTPIVQEMAERGTPYRGFIYAGMMMTRSGPKVIEFNIRLGDPETQPLMMMLKSDLYSNLANALYGRLLQEDIQFKEGAACCIVLASQGYPGDYKKGLPIFGLDRVATNPGVKVFHAGTAIKDGQIVNSGGRVLGVTGYSSCDLDDAINNAYQGVSEISIPGRFSFRRDIAQKAFR